MFSFSSNHLKQIKGYSTIESPDKVRPCLWFGLWFHFFGGGKFFELDDWNGCFTPRCLLTYTKMFWRWQDKWKLLFETGRLDFLWSKSWQNSNENDWFPTSWNLQNTYSPPKSYGPQKKSRFGICFLFSNVFVFLCFLVHFRVFTLGCISSWWPQDWRRKCLTL